MMDEVRITVAVKLKIRFIRDFLHFPVVIFSWKLIIKISRSVFGTVCNHKSCYFE